MAEYTTEQRQAMAKRGTAMPASSAGVTGSYPIPDRRHLAKAIMALGRAKDPAATKRWIIKRARALHSVDMLPKSWHVH